MTNLTQIKQPGRRLALTASVITFALGLTVSLYGQASGGSGTASGSGSTASGTRSGTTGSSDTMHGSTHGAGGSHAADMGTKTTSAECRQFIQKAAKSGLKEVRLSQLAAERSTNPAVRDYAQMLVREHQQANTNLASIAQVRGVAIASDDAVSSTRTAGTYASSGSSTGATSGAGSSSRDTQREDTAATSRSTAGGQAGSQAPMGGTHSARSGTMADEDTNEAYRDIEQAATKLAEKSGAEFDRAYVEHMIKDHKEAISMFEDASKQTDDSGVSSFAQSTLPKLRGHLSRAEALSEQLKKS